MVSVPVMTRAVILQSNYIPWKGYFDLLNSADVFVVYDSVQFTKNDWRNRNKLISPVGPVWLTIPVETSGAFGQTIREVRIADHRWARKHWSTISQTLAKTAHFSAVKDEWRGWYDAVANFELLHEVNVHLLSRIALQLGIKTKIVDVAELTLSTSDRIERLVEICSLVGADTYLTGPAGLSYINPKTFADEGIALEVMRYDGYPTHAQRSTDFVHGVSILDLIANTGDAARTHLRGSIEPVTEHA